MNKKYIYIGIAVIVAILISLYIGKSIGQKDQKDIQIHKQIEYIHVDNQQSVKKIDSLNLVINSLKKKDVVLKKDEAKKKDKADQIIITKPDNPECNELYTNATNKISLLEEIIVIKDSVESNLRVQLVEKDKIISLKDRVLANKDTEIGLLKELGKKRDKKYSISIQVGTGGAITKNSNAINVQYVPVYVGIGISRNILSF